MLETRKNVMGSREKTKPEQKLKKKRAERKRPSSVPTPILREAP